MLGFIALLRQNRHSGIAYMTRHSVHGGKAQAMLAVRQTMPIRLTQVDWFFLILGASAAYCIHPGR